MIYNNELRKLLGQSKEAYAQYLESKDGDALAEAGELLWECLKVNIAQVNKTKTDNINALRAAAAQLGEAYNQLFDHSYHFHSWYLGAVPNDFAAEEKLYLKTVKTLEKITKNIGNKCRTKKQELENAASAI